MWRVKLDWYICMFWVVCTCMYKGMVYVHWFCTHVHVCAEGWIVYSTCMCGEVDNICVCEGVDSVNMYV